ncbi:HAMP domain-containing histidine kinase [Patescibacteria group bacterium]|nr:HAMP domain-containing histidine kinase [Patescibacteria group bacterium]
MKQKQTPADLAKFPEENPFPVLKVDDQGVLIYANKASDFILKSWKCVPGKKVPPHWKRSIAEALKLEKVKELEIRRQQDFYSLSIVPISKSNYVYIYGFDVTRRRQSEDKVKDLSDLKNKFIRIVSHQFRTPLNSIKWNIETLLMGELGKLKKEQEVFLRSSYEAQNEVLRRLHDLFTVMDIEEGRTALKKENISVESLWGSVLTTCKKNCKLKKIDFKYVSPQKALPKIEADPEKIRSVFEHLSNNAVNYTQENGKVTAKISKKANRIRFEIKDNGIGIPPAEQKYIFDRFFRATNASAMITDASGIGLSIAKYYVKQHKGTIGFKSEEDRGSTFWFEIPIK